MRYEEYRTTANQYIPSIPKTWNLKSGRFCFEENKEKNTDLSQHTLLQFTYGEIVRKRVQDISKDDESIICKYTVVQPNDIMLNGLNLNYDFVSQRVGMVKESGVITSAYLSLRCHDVFVPAYANYLLKTFDAQKIFHGMGSGVRLTLAFPEFSKIQFPVPPREEQDQIVRYLDWQLSKINKLIHGYQKQIKLLEERKLTVINEAITKGITHDVPLKKTNSNWMGDIPKHWEISTLGRNSFSFLGKMLNSQDYSKKEKLGSVKPYLCAKDVHFSGVDISESKEMCFTEQELIRYRVNKGDLLVVEGGAGAGGASIYEYDDERYIQNSIHVIREKESLTNSYLYYWIYSIVKRGYMDFVCNKATIPHFTGDKLKSTVVPLPPVGEQKQIVAYIKEQEDKIDALISGINNNINMFKEYRTRLISDAVTGQMDVRGIEIPDYTPEEDMEIAEDAQENEETEVNTDAESDE